MNEGTERRPGLDAAAKVALIFAMALAAAACGRSRESASDHSVAAAPVDSASMVERGHYLVTVGGCNDCHTPLMMGANGPQPDMARMLSGHPESLVMPPPPQPGSSPWAWYGAITSTAFAGPWGVTYAINLTPDDTGLGVVNEEMFVQAMRTGKHFGQGRPIMPPMPWQGLGQMTDEDLRAVYTYLRSIPPIRNNVPPYQPPSGGTQ